METRSASFVPIELWQEIEPEKETAHLLKSENVKERLLEAKSCDEGLSLEDVSIRIGVRAHR